MNGYLKSILLLLFYIYFSLGYLQAQCQVCMLSKLQTDEVLYRLRLQTDVVVYSGCEYNDIARKVRIDTIYAVYLENYKRYEIFVKGTIIGIFNIENQRIVKYTATAIDFHESIDLAYTHIKKQGYFDRVLNQYIWDAVCLGLELGYPCDPCIDPFDYPYFED
ncbi:MAG: hypothetical protein EAZ55_06240 [Cytophagales bacterium]|nr:MAG: hypothetical protein EAZ55_06240 [Cytophagales bacterium]